MSSRVLVTGVVLFVAVALAPGRAHGEPCVTACRDEVQACIASDCQALVHRPLRRCKHQCKKSIVHDCFADLTVCGATVARSPKPGVNSGGGGSGGGGSGGW
jgi:hypothetical protein